MVAHLRRAPTLQFSRASRLLSSTLIPLQAERGGPGGQEKGGTGWVGPSRRPAGPHLGPLAQPLTQCPKAHHTTPLHHTPHLRPQGLAPAPMDSPIHPPTHGDSLPQELLVVCELDDQGDLEGVLQGVESKGG